MNEEREDEKGYNGWANYQTWNVALWIQNDDRLYELARGCSVYNDFKETLRDSCEPGTGGICVETPDHVAWNDSGLDIPRLDELIKELRG
jgi:hypothetical protein